MAKKERTDGDGGVFKDGLIAIGIAVATGACVAVGRDAYEAVRDRVGDWRDERRKRKEKEARAAKNGDGSTKKKARKSKKKAKSSK